RLVGRYMEERVHVELQLSLRGGDDLGRGVSDVQDRDAGGEIDETVAVDVFDDRARRASSDDRMDVRDALRNRRGAALEPLARLGTGDLGGDLALLRDVQVCLLVCRRA